MFNLTDLRDFDPKQFVDQLGLPEFDLSRLDPTNLDLTRFDVRNIDLPRFEMPKVEMPKVEMPKVEMPKVEMPDVDRIAGLARDAAYVGIGAAVIAAQKTDTALRELTDQIAAVITPLIDSVHGRTTA